MLNPVDTHIQRVSQEIFKKIYDLSLNELIVNYLTFENELRTEIVSDVDIFVNYRKKRKTFWKVDSFFDNSKRTFVIQLNIPDNNSGGSVVKEVKIENQIGLIESLVIIVDNNLSKTIDVNILYKVVVSRILIKYSTIELAFLRHFEDISKRFFEKIYDRINLQLVQSGKEVSFNNIWLILGHKKSLHYICDIKKIKDLLVLFKSNQIANASPFQLLIDLLTTPLPYEMSLTKISLNSKKKVSREWKQIKYKDDVNLFYSVLAEKLLYPSDGPTVFAICEQRDYVLSIVTSNHIEAIILPEIRLINDEIIELFKEGLSGYSLLFKHLAVVTKSINSIDFAGFFGKFLGAFISEYTH